MRTSLKHRRGILSVCGRSQDLARIYSIGYFETMEQEISLGLFRPRTCHKRTMGCAYIIASFLVFHLVTPIASQIYTGNDFGFETGRYERSAPDDSFTETNELPRYQKKELQSEFLTLLGLKQRPRPPSLRGGHNHSAPQFMLDLYNSLQGSIEEDGEAGGFGGHVYSGYHRGVLSSMLRMGNYNYTSMEIRAVDDADTIMSLPVLYRKQSLERHGPHRYHFGVASFPRQDILTSAELRVYRDLPHDYNRDNIFTLKVYQIGSQSDGGNILMDSLVIDNSDVGWLVFDVTEGSQILQTYPGARYSMQLVAVNARGDEVEPNEVGLRGVGETEQLEPFMVAFFKTNEEVRRDQLNRARRSKSSKKRKRNREVENVQNDPIPESLYGRSPANKKRSSRECRRRSFYVSFERLEWSDWIIAPRGYHAYYCDGECSFPLHSKLNATNHAIVQTLVHLIDSESAPQACCAPTKTSSIEVLYYDSFNNVIIRKYKQMVVKACGCH